MGFLQNIANLALAPITAAGNFIGQNIVEPIINLHSGPEQTFTTSTPQDITSTVPGVILGDAIAGVAAPLAIAIAPLAGTIGTLGTLAVSQSSRASDFISKGISQSTSFIQDTAKTIDSPDLSSAGSNALQTIKDNPEASVLTAGLLAYLGGKTAITAYQAYNTSQNTAATKAETAATLAQNNPANLNPANQGPITIQNIIPNQTPSTLTSTQSIKSSKTSTKKKKSSKKVVKKKKTTKKKKKSKKKTIKRRKTKK